MLLEKLFLNIHEAEVGLMGWATIETVPQIPQIHNSEKEVMTSAWQFVNKKNGRRKTGSQFSLRTQL